MSTLTFLNYCEQAKTTAVYPDAGEGNLNTLFYLSMGLVGEAGELSNKLKKVLRDGDGILTNEHREALRGEYGDVLWYLGQLANEVNQYPFGEKFLDDPYHKGAAEIWAFEFELRHLDEFEQVAIASIELSIIAADLSAPITGRIATAGRSAMPSGGFNEGFVGPVIRKAIPLLGFIAERLDTSLSAIGQANLDKLASRKARGAISGAGDNR